ncbi:DEAD/DEAH box helicase [Phaeovulum vinaykumarii]|uniref:ATP-dependent RNA helicase DeaD n=1 Tax=Phaeovulum vinaykumarii TaxID=407234 RepID=A0A1N7K730_9RHOB|nr:ATP-dependent RNA helicase DeaD [Phaeovulum vinaykumarii]SOB93385.1 ATP-dependent RNA helicase DeaD [Phaeovulum vinaykumarii]
MNPTLSAALSERGYDTLTEVQEAVTAPEVQGRDLLVSAQTGSGKTVGFGLAIAPDLLGEAERLGLAAAPLALVVAPTRELALQVARELGWLYGQAGGRVVTCVGGMDMRDERRALERGAHIVVGTPGRLCDHLRRGSLETDALRAVVLDEADEMLDLGFREDLEMILSAAPAERRTLLFSATVSPVIARLAEQFQRDALRVSTKGSARQHTDISYQVLWVAPHDSEHAIINLLRYHDAENAIVFANTRASVTHLAARLANRGLSVVALSGELNQAARSHALQAMRDGRARVCVATDVAARGIDLPGLDLVVHAELPLNTEALLHRSGRTGRAGRKGISALIVPTKLTKKAERLLKFAKIEAEWTQPPSAEAIRARDEARLLEDPLWSKAAEADEAAFAARLLAQRSPEEIATACLRLFRAGLSAPEELSPPDEKPGPRPARADFGPSRWFALSVGRRENAEPRWILPLLCRGANLDKSDIGAIRVQPSETYVQIAEGAAAGLAARIGAARTLEEGIDIRPMDGAPDLAPARKAAPGSAPRRAGPPAGPRPRRSEAEETAAPRAPRNEGPRNEGLRKEGKPHWKKPAPKAGRAPWVDDDAPARKPRAAKPGAPKPRAAASADPGAKPRKPRSPKKPPPGAR